MFQRFFIFASIGVALGNSSPSKIKAPQAWSLNGVDGAKILGPVKYPVKDASTNKAGLRESVYIPIRSSVSWGALGSLCKDAFRNENATRVYLEVRQELELLSALLEPINPEALYWIGGQWNVDNARYEWANGVPFGDEWANIWDEGHPGVPTPLTKVMLHTRGGYHFQTAFEDDFHSYICELQMPEVPCVVDSDLVVLLDGSGSVGLAGFELVKQFIANLTDAWLENGQNRNSLIVFATTTTTEFSLDSGLSASEIKEKIYNAGYPNGGTNTHLGLEEALGELARNNRTLPQNIVLLTDGYSSSPALTLQQAQLILDAGVEVFADGVGSINYDELVAVTGNKAERVFTVDGFENLVGVLEGLQDEICST